MIHTVHPPQSLPLAATTAALSCCPSFLWRFRNYGNAFISRADSVRVPPPIEGPARLRARAYAYAHIIGMYSAFRLACIIPAVMVNAVRKLEIQEKWTCCSSDRRELCLVI